MAREIMAEGRFLRLVRENGWEWVERTGISGVVVIAALTNEGKVLFVEQHRRPIGTAVIELPAGLAGDIAGQEGEDLADAARRELEEETGYTAERFDVMTSGPVSAGLSSEVLTFFRAVNVRRIGDGGGDESEDITVHEIPLNDAERWLAERAAAGVPADPKVFAGLYFLRR